jgi:nicotinate-nucleotide pyrophosphorylase (carboxylating)
MNPLVPELFSTLLPEGSLENAVKQWLADDMPTFDVGGFVVGSVERTAILWMKSPGVFAGKPFFDAVFSALDVKVEWTETAAEGVYLKASPQHKIKLATITGPVHKILQGERTALNTLSRCSGVATASQHAVRVARDLHWKGWVAGTRKTTPGFRIVEKYGLLIGGAATHRLDLSQMVMLKDNHIWATGSIRAAVTLARQVAGFSQKIEVECQSLDQAMEAAQAGADICMLDNFCPSQLKQDAAVLKGLYPHVLIEASGGITTETMVDYLSEHVDIVSQGKLTQGYECIDFSLKVVVQDK